MMNNNEFVTRFEHRLCDYTGARHAVAVDRCTNAILLSLVAQGIKEDVTIPERTYLSVPMTLALHGYNISFREEQWEGSYQIGSTNVWDCAVGFERNMYQPGTMQCLSFQQKKRLAIGTGGAILLDDGDIADLLRRLRHDGRDSSVPVAYDDPNKIILGYHMYMTPNQAADGILLLNQLDENYQVGSWSDYPNISVLECFK